MSNFWELTSIFKESGHWILNKIDFINVHLFTNMIIDVCTCNLGYFSNNNLANYNQIEPSIKRGYYVIIYVGHFGLSVSVQFLSDPCFISQIPCTSVLQCYGNICVRVPKYCLHPVAEDIACPMRNGGRDQAGRFFCGCARKIILARNLLRQAKAQLWIPVQFPVQKETGGTSSTDRALVRTSDCDWNTVIDPTMYLWKGFFAFCCYESTQICEYD